MKLRLKLFIVIASCLNLACSSTNVPPSVVKITIPVELKTPCVPAELASDDMGELLRVAIANAQIINDCDRKKQAIVELVE